MGHALYTFSSGSGGSVTANGVGAFLVAAVFISSTPTTTTTTYGYGGYRGLDRC